MMTKQPISGVAPVELGEATVMTVWPSVAVYRLGRSLGQMYAIRWPNIYIFRLGNLLAVLAVPIALVLYFLRVLPRCGVRYRLTNRRVIVQRGVGGVDAQSIRLDEFDAIQIDSLPGQAWYDAGDLVFQRDGGEVFRLAAVSRPAAFRQICRKSRAAYVGVKRVLAAEQAVAATS